MILLIGIDDTDNKESRGTGFLSRQLAVMIEAQNLGGVTGITRHQLYVHSDIPYTSQNSSACLAVESKDPGQVWGFCSGFVTRKAAPGSDAGLCMAFGDNRSREVEQWGLRAKKEVLTLEEGVSLAQRNEVRLKGLTGSLTGQIGALAAVGLRMTGNDGRFIWLGGGRELRDFDSGIYTVNELIWETGIDLVRTLDGTLVPGNEKVFCSGWTRPLLMDHFAVLMVEKVNFADYGWKTVSKEHIRTIS